MHGPASAMQVGLLYESALSGRGRANIEQIVVEANGLDEPALRVAWAELAARHDALRLCLRPDDGATFRLAEQPLPVIDLRPVDLGPCPPEDRAKRLEAFLAEDRAAGADPRTYPNWRVSLLRFGPQETVMVWTIHHALIDGSSMEIVLEDLSTLLEGRALAPLMAPAFIEVVSRLAKIDKAPARDFFRAMHAGSGGLAPFARSGLSGSSADARMEHLSIRLAKDESAQLRAQVQAFGATPLNAVQAAWGLVLARWTGQAEACFGLVEAGRDLVPGCAQTVGCLIATLPLRIGFDPTQTLRSLLVGLRATTRDMRPFVHVGLGDIRRWAGITGQAQLFDTIVMYARGGLPARMQARGGFWAARPVRLLEEGTAAATLAVHDEDAIELILEYDPARLGARRARAALMHVAHLLRAIAQAAPEDRIDRLGMLGASEQARLMSAAHPAVTVAPECPCIATRFEAIARAQPDTLAVVDAADGQSLVYAELDQRANALAWQIHQAGLGPEDVIALHLPRSIDHVVALLAVLKAGAAFLPLDPDQPISYVRELCESAGARAVIAPQTSGLARGTALHFTPSTTTEKTPPPRPGPDPARLAYVLHTSGSSGKPKGVMGLAGALSAHADAVIQAYRLGSGDRVLQFAGLAFDVCLEEIIPTLLCGARLVLRDSRAGDSVSGFLDMVARMRVTVLNLPASFWHVLVEDMDQRELRLAPSVRLVVTGSERIAAHALADWRRIAPQVAWINAYGPTEATISCTAWVDDGGETGPEVPIGRPLGHATTVLRAFDGTLTPWGGVGTLWIGGAAVTRGYLRQPEHSARVFGPDILDPAGRSYCTGDLARWREDGQLVFLGRRDRQVKLRGHRIDMHQVESVLGELAGVARAHVALDPGMTGAAGGARLLAWLVCDHGPDATDLAELTREAARRLPGYMLPSLIVVDQLPVGPNGKIRTAALPRPVPVGRTPGEARPEIIDPLTRRIADCMAMVLDLDFVAPEADFHDLGGDSLTAMRLASLIETQTGNALGAVDLRNHPTPQALAAFLSGATTGPRFIIPIQATGSRHPLFAVHVLGRNEELFRPLATALGPDQPVFGLSLGVPRNLGEIDVQRTARVYFQEVQRHHPQGPVSLIAVSMAAYFAFELAQLLRGAGREVRVLAVLDAMGPDGRPALRGLAKLRAHLGQFQRRGVAHLRSILAHRLEALQVAREGRKSSPDEVTGYNLVAANVRAVEGYMPLPYDGRLTIFRADASFWDSPEALETGLGWASVARGGYDLHDLPGTHLSILHQGQVDALARRLSRLMGRD